MTQVHRLDRELQRLSARKGAAAGTCRRKGTGTGFRIVNPNSNTDNVQKGKKRNVLESIRELLLYEFKLHVFLHFARSVLASGLPPLKEVRIPRRNGNRYK